MTRTENIYTRLPRPPLEHSPSAFRPTNLRWPTTQEFQQAIQQVLECYVIESRTFIDMTSGALDRYSLFVAMMLHTHIFVEKFSS
jgi:hypothetical protein